jgi:hypothetical protein
MRKLTGSIDKGNIPSIKDILASLSRSPGNFFSTAAWTLLMISKLAATDYTLQEVQVLDLMRK